MSHSDSSVHETPPDSAVTRPPSDVHSASRSPHNATVVENPAARRLNFDDPASRPLSMAQSNAGNLVEIRRVLEEALLTSVKLKERDKEEIWGYLRLQNLHQHLSPADNSRVEERLRFWFVVEVHGWPTALTDQRERRTETAAITLSDAALASGKSRNTRVGKKSKNKKK